MQITVLMENSTQNPTLAAEHGLSLFIRHGGRSWLLDAGASGDFVKNADALGLPPEQVQAAILSHGHYDHGGGLAAFFARNHAAPVYAMRAAGECYLSGDGPDRHPIGLPDTVLPRYAGRFVWLDGPLQPAPGVTLLPHTTPGLAAIGAARKLYRAGAGQIEPDDFRHELTAVFETDAGLVAVNSCSHGGVPAILAEVQARFPGRPDPCLCGRAASARAQGRAGDLHLLPPGAAQSGRQLPPLRRAGGVHRPLHRHGGVCRPAVALGGASPSAEHRHADFAVTKTTPGGQPDAARRGCAAGMWLEKFLTSGRRWR